MASTIFQAAVQVGLPSVTVELFADGSDSVANGSGDSMAEETNRKGLYSATVTEALLGTFYCVVRSNTTVVATGWVYLQDDANTYCMVEDKSLAQYVESEDIAIVTRQEMDSNSTRLADIDDATGTSGVLISSGTGAGQLSISAGVAESNVKQINDSAASAANLALSSGVIVPGAVVAGTLSEQQASTDLTEDTDEHYSGTLLVFTSGALTGQRLSVTDYDGTTKVLTFSQATEIPQVGDSFILV
tara:strand:- start:551 stop:1285 length:735 start_codon:yes stop_codon:yes gene_type:complete